jgi:predicted RNA-binding protein YlxR (DUF448 family)
MADPKRGTKKRSENQPAHLERRCIACRKSCAKSGLLRFVLRDNAVLVDEDGNMPGRGAYIHPNHSCWAKMGERGMWEHAFRCGKGVLSQNDWVSLRQRVFKIIEALGSTI